jgi:hypothetical protein
VSNVSSKLARHQARTGSYCLACKGLTIVHHWLIWCARGCARQAPPGQSFGKRLQSKQAVHPVSATVPLRKNRYQYAGWCYAYYDDSTRQTVVHSPLKASFYPPPDQTRGWVTLYSGAGRPMQLAYEIALLAAAARVAAARTGLTGCAWLGRCFVVCSKPNPL